jgi:hypothetical protein
VSGDRLVAGKLAVAVAGVVLALVGLRRGSPLAVLLGGVLAGAGLKLHRSDGGAPAGSSSTSV